MLDSLMPNEQSVHKIFTIFSVIWRGQKHFCAGKPAGSVGQGAHSVQSLNQIFIA